MRSPKNQSASNLRRDSEQTDGTYVPMRQRRNTEQTDESSFPKDATHPPRYQFVNGSMITASYAVNVTTVAWIVNCVQVDHDCRPPPAYDPPPGIAPEKPNYGYGSG